MARGPSARVRIHRDAIDRVFLAVADGALEVGETIVREANPPDATPYGVGLARSGGWLGYVDGKKVGGGGLDGKQPKAPRSEGVSRTRGILIIAGFGFPGRFQELGTINHPAQPFLGPSADQVLPRAHSIMAARVGPKLRGMP